MKRSAVFLALFLAAGMAHADDGLSLGVGVDYSSGDYGSDTTTKILSVPFSAKYATGDWTFKASLPWLRVQGDANVVPGLGSLVNLNPNGRGRGNGGGGGDPTAPTSGTTSGIGDLRLAATYAIPLQGQWGVDLTGNVKVATADEDRAWAPAPTTMARPWTCTAAWATRRPCSAASATPCSATRTSSKSIRSGMPTSASATSSATAAPA
jgi:hypothetical protein